MPRQIAVSVENNFRNGLVTEATGLNFPENACTETFDCVFKTDGSVIRRPGFDFEAGHSTKTIDRSIKAISRYLWKNVSGDGNLSIEVVQIGDTIYFYKTNEGALSEGAVSDTISLTAVSGAPAVDTVEAQFSDGNGYLFVTHPYCEPMRVSYDTSTDNATATSMTLQVRDFEGLDDGLAVNERVTSLDDDHKYNLLNQGWTDVGTTWTSTSSVTVEPSQLGTDVSWAIPTGQTITVGETLILFRTTDLTKVVTGPVASYSGTNLAVTVKSTTVPPSFGAIAQWTIGREIPYYKLFFDGVGSYPSNADVWWYYKNSEDVFSVAEAVRLPISNSQAPKGHYILEAHDLDRATASGIAGLASTTSSYQRVSTSAFFAGRMFYSGINYSGFNSKIYFTQIIERPEQYQQCYQVNDPTSELLHDLLPSDGGVIEIQEAGTIFKLMTVPGGLVVFAANGVWFITGSSGLGFVATDYTVQKISTVNTLSASSFIDVSGYPCWWNSEGIWIISTEGGAGIPSVKSLTEQKIKSLITEIPTVSKRFVKGYYNPVSQIIKWLYRSAETSQTTEQYEYDRILNFNTATGAFYLWALQDSDVKVHALVVTDSVSGATAIDTVIDGSSNTVVDASANQVISYSNEGTAQDSVDKFLVSYADGSSYSFTFAEANNTTYLDWVTHDGTGVNYDSYFISGYKLRGEGIRKHQSNYIRVYSCMEEPVQYYFQGIWDYALTGSGTGRWSSRQLVTHTDTNYSFTSRRLKVRGHGLSLQFRVESSEGEPFDIIGWSSMDSVNQLP